MVLNRFDRPRPAGHLRGGAYCIVAAGRPPSIEEHLLAQTFVSIVYVGSVYALLASGWALTYGVTGSFNFAHPVAFMAGASAVILIEQSGHPLWQAILGGIVAGGVAGVLIDRVALWPVRVRRLGPLGLNAPLLAGVAAFALCSALLERYPVKLRGALHLPAARFGHTVIPADVVLAASCVAALLSLWLLVRATRLGIAIRATANNASAARAAGVTFEWIFVQSTFIASAAGAAAGVALSLHWGFVGSLDDFNVLFLALASVALGGLCSIPGVAGASFVLAAVQVALSSWLGHSDRGAASSAIAFGVVIASLALLPRGIFPRGLLRST